MNIPKAPLLAISASSEAAERSITLLQKKTSILDRLLGGESALSVAQSLNMSEKDINTTLKEALAVQTEFMRENASTMQMKLYQQHEMLYQLAVQNMQYVEMKDVRDGDQINTMAVHKTDINWFREARAQLKEIATLILPFLKEAKPTGPTINVTIIEDDVLYRRVAEDFADIDVFSND